MEIGAGYQVGQAREREVVWFPLLGELGIRNIRHSALKEDRMNCIDAFGMYQGKNVALALRTLDAERRGYTTGYMTLRTGRPWTGVPTEWQKLFGERLTGPMPQYYCGGGWLKGELVDWAVLRVPMLRRAELGGGVVMRHSIEFVHPDGGAVFRAVNIPECEREYPGIIARCSPEIEDLVINGRKGVL